jgi:hypothetical protein
MGWTTFWAIFSKTHLVTLAESHFHENYSTGRLFYTVVHRQYYSTYIFKQTPPEIKFRGMTNILKFQLRTYTRELTWPS